MPTSRTTGIARRGWIPAAAVYTRHLADRDLDAADALVADAQDALGVGDDEQVDVVGSQPVVEQRLLDVLGPVDGQEDPARAGCTRG